MSLASHYVKTQGHLIGPGIEVWEFDFEMKQGERILWSKTPQGVRNRWKEHVLMVSTYPEPWRTGVQSLVSCPVSKQTGVHFGENLAGDGS